MPSCCTHSKVEKISNTEWILLSKCVNALQSYEEATKQLSSSSSSISDVIPLIVSLKTTLQKNVSEGKNTDSCLELEDSEDQSTDKDEEETTNAINVIKRTMRADLDRRFTILDSIDIYRIAIYLDP